MDNKSIIKQLEKALEKEDKELRLRVEVLVDMMKEYTFTPPIIQPSVQPFPQVPQPTVAYESEGVAQSVIEAKKKPIKEGNPTSVRGAGGIVSNGEQITYSRPKGT